MRPKLSAALITVALVGGCAPGVAAGPAGSGTGTLADGVTVAAPVALAVHTTNDRVLLRHPGAVVWIFDGKKRAR